MSEREYLDPRKEMDPSGRPRLRTREIFFRGKVVFEEGARGDYAYYIEKGRVEVSVKSGAHRVVVSELGAGEVFGEMALLSSQPRTATVQAVEDTTVTVISENELKKKLSQLSDPVIRSLIFLLIDRLRKANEGQVQQYAKFMDFQNRFLGLNHRLANEFSEKDRDAMRAEIAPLLDQLEGVLNKYAAKHGADGSSAG
ncbi:cyclic nucleotide-binding domain-containing protein [Roseospira navarrensis]|nr:cyclic nucleotide-binding domain-containing protein [Roseospira navarrensis]